MSAKVSAYNLRQRAAIFLSVAAGCHRLSQAATACVIPEPLGGAHREPNEMASKLKQVLFEELAVLRSQTTETLLTERYSRLMRYGEDKEQ